MYDLILCVLATTKNNRLSTFSKIGYKNSGKYKFKIVYLVDDDQKPDFIKDDWFNCYGHSHSTRFVEYLKNTHDESKWFFQVDDDSCTDVDKTIELLNEFYDYEDPVVLTGSSTYLMHLPRYITQEEISHNCFCHHLDENMQQVLNKMNIENLPKNMNNYKEIPNISCGWEHSIFSAAAVNKIKKYNRLQEYIIKCVEGKPNFSDQVPFVLAKIAKIPISSCFFTSPIPNVEEYTAINKNGRFSHIHHVCYPSDHIDYLKEIVENNITFESADQVADFFEKRVDNTNWFFYHIIDKDVKARCAINLFQNKIKILDIVVNALTAYKPIPDKSLNFNFESYELENKNWKFYRDHFEITNSQNQNLIFSKLKNKLYGCRIKENEFFLLSRMHPLDSVYWSTKKHLGTNFMRIEQ